MVAFFTGKAARECILTFDNLVRIDTILVNGCYLCERDAESTPIIMLNALYYLLFFF